MIMKNYTTIPDEWWLLPGAYGLIDGENNTIVNKEDRGKCVTLITRVDVLILAKIYSFGKEHKTQKDLVGGCPLNNKELGEVLKLSIDKIEKSIGELYFCGLIKESLSNNIDAANRMLYVDTGIVDDVICASQYNTTQFISSCLKNNTALVKCTPSPELINTSTYTLNPVVINADYIDEDLVADYIKNMSYQDFLNTSYWKTISNYKKQKSNHRCMLCNNNNNLRTHHKSYERHGYEHRIEVINEDLIVLCDDCHKKFHDIVD